MCSQIPDTQTWEGVFYSQDTEGWTDSWGTLYAVRNGFKTVVLTKNEYSVGRLPSCDVVLSNENTMCERNSLTPESQDLQKICVGVKEDLLATFSKMHFKIKKDVCVVLEDNSSNGTFINGTLLGKGKKTILQSNDQISLAHPDYKVKDDFVVSRSLGKGAYGEVMLVFQKKTFDRFAMKVVKKRTLNPTKDILMNEVNILRSLDHPCVIKIHNVVNSPESVFIFLDYMEGGDLFERVKSLGKLKESETKWISYQISKAVEYLHKQGIAHRDLKPENILLSSDKKNPIIKITDFGLSRFFNSQMVMKTVCGTPSYVAPEILETKGCGVYSNQVDVWSMGVILYVCLSGSLPFSSERQDMTLGEQICSGSYSFPERYWRGVTKKAIDLVKKMMTVNPKLRITVNMILSQSWFQDRDLEQRLEVTNLFENRGDENEPPPKRQCLDAL
ncbi:Ovarian-specific serine/threonine-protein kinase Lok [Gryllus bimaculatus]|nr:Ovarian-specific serine/threonine-protein kinase Lok [Gryllus bimaculatus]